MAIIPALRCQLSICYADEVQSQTQRGIDAVHNSWRDPRPVPVAQYVGRQIIVIYRSLSYSSKVKK